MNTSDPVRDDTEAGTGSDGGPDDTTTPLGTSTRAAGTNEAVTGATTPLGTPTPNTSAAPTTPLGASVGAAPSAAPTRSQTVLPSAPDAATTPLYSPNAAYGATPIGNAAYDGVPTGPAGSGAAPGGNPAADGFGQGNTLPGGWPGERPTTHTWTGPGVGPQQGFGTQQKRPAATTFEGARSLSTTALVLGIVGMVFNPLGGFSIAALVCGIIAKSQIDQLRANGEAAPPDGMAIAAIVLGGIGFAATALLKGFLL